MISRFRPFWSRLTVTQKAPVSLAGSSMHAGSDPCAKCYALSFKPAKMIIPRPCAEQLEKVEAGMDSINQDMQIAEKALKGMELCCGIFPKFWKK